MNSFHNDTSEPSIASEYSMLSFFMPISNIAVFGLKSLYVQRQGVKGRFDVTNFLHV